MTPRPDDELDEMRLQALFDQTAELPSGPTLTKLSARAADIPARAGLRPFWQSLRFLVPAVAAVAGAVAVFALPELRGGESETAPIAHTAPAPPPTPSTAAAQALAASEPATPEAEEISDELFADLALGEEDELAFDPMYPESDAELDAWLDVTAELLDEGG